ncbi:hypothetical protein FNH22_23995 [Fulvivirga sp. M361]|uniref:hypothetical protein n=1 Tax=Fulvivirga sp. M361 TaxID=2594266 RepID=UPI00117B8CB1|nr:hypothetical protein [Fulvivirga sp. M361]TRX51626.1 hypothetical protein FNH22_23995 [Fulvivirga sp. M361]
MIKLFLSLHIVEDRLAFNPPLPVEKNISCFDLDNYSDDLVTNTAIQAVDQAEKVVVFITSSSPNSKLGSVLKLLNVLVRNKRQKLLIYNGSHPMLDKMLGMFRDSEVYRDLNDTEVRHRTSAFLDQDYANN